MPVTLVVAVTAIVAAIAVWAMSRSRTSARPGRSVRRGALAGALARPSSAVGGAGASDRSAGRRRPDARRRLGRRRSDRACCRSDLRHGRSRTRALRRGTGRSPSGAAATPRRGRRRSSTGSPISAPPGCSSMIAVAVGLFDVVRNRNLDVALFLVVVVAGVALINNVLKWLIDRERPDVAHLVGTSGSSFPSGHSAAAAATWFALALVVGRRWSRRRRSHRRGGRRPDQRGGGGVACAARRALAHRRRGRSARRLGVVPAQCPRLRRALPATG